jgi:hypothetical protein
MDSDEYRSLSATCLIMANQSNLPDVRARWLVLARDCADLRRDSSATERQSRPLSTRPKMRAAVNLSAA